MEAFSRREDKVLGDRKQEEKDTIYLFIYLSFTYF